ncbi:Zinc finger protein Xfin like protein [Argiope bruennichi]|uniref:Zinc finger protein Xfin like protein n=2 Tax=Argiope bruennichi TaxID=94029 RepID=A0A8T0E6A2_ARGBR|nr:Zinc finger protein Xfin like protein [Argiope bruennichi]
MDISVDDSSEQSVSKTFSSKKLSCHICNKSFAYQACLDKHIKKSNCKATFPSLSKTIKKPNLEVQESETHDKKHVCSICGKNFARKSALEGHEAIHLAESYDSPYEEFSDDNSFHEEECDEYISQPKKPRLSKINIQQSYTCGNCNFVCFSKQTLTKHMKNHKDEEGLSDRGDEDTENDDDSLQKFTKCDEKFCSSEELQEHNIVHMKKENEKKPKFEVEEPGEYSCEICDKIFHSKRRLKKHLLFHVARKINDDDDSEKLAIGVERKQRSKDFACEICGKRFAGETCLKKHIMKHENGEITEKKSKRSKKEKIIQTLICEFCNEEFTGRRGAYVKHVHSHTPEVCGICDARFVDRQGLREHCKIHIGTEEGRMFVECSQKALDAKNGLLPPEPKVEYIYLVLR